MIGMFDSGSGGLTVLKPLLEQFPNADIVYFGDIGNAPYGSRSREELSTLTVGAIERLRSYGATRIVSACNSVSASLAISLFDSLDIEPSSLIEMVGPTVSYFRDTEEPLTLCATPATINSGVYQNAFHMIGREVRAIAIPELAGSIERGAVSEIDASIKSAFENVAWSSHEVLILACTHYPLVIERFHAIVPGVQLFDPGIAVAERVMNRWWPQEIGKGTLRFCISKDSEVFRRLVAQLFEGKEYSIEVV